MPSKLQQYLPLLTDISLQRMNHSVYNEICLPSDKNQKKSQNRRTDPVIDWNESQYLSLMISFTFKYLANILPYLASELGEREPTITGTMVKLPATGAITLAM